MRNGPKQLVIDKSAFEAISLEQLKDFAASRSLVLPEVLWYECLTSDELLTEPFGRLRKLLDAGSWVCPSIHTILEWEARHLSPYESIAFKREGCEVKPNQNLNQRRNTYLTFCQNLIQIWKRFDEILQRDEPELIREVRMWDGSNKGRPDRLRQWVELVDSQDMHQCSRALFEGATGKPERFCLSSEWVTWHLLRLTGVLMHEQAFLTHQGGAPGVARIEHDLQDILYVVSLACVDGLLTRDKKFVEPLARAAFPDKEVFSSLEEVPDAYRCRRDSV